MIVHYLLLYYILSKSFIFYIFHYLNSCAAKVIVSALSVTPELTTYPTKSTQYTVDSVNPLIIPLKETMLVFVEVFVNLFSDKIAPDDAAPYTTLQKTLPL